MGSIPGINPLLSSNPGYSFAQGDPHAASSNKEHGFYP